MNKVGAMIPLARTFRVLAAGRVGPADRPPLPSGHPVTWGTLTRGTLLECSAYPYPVFDCDAGEGAP